jgi:hypothetical protein
MSKKSKPPNYTLGVYDILPTLQSLYPRARQEVLEGGKSGAANAVTWLVLVKRLKTFHNIDVVYNFAEESFEVKRDGRGFIVS